MSEAEPKQIFPDHLHDGLPPASAAAAIAADLVALMQAEKSLVFVDATGDRLDRIVASARQFAPELEVLGFPALDVLPYDRMPPAAAVVGQRVATLVRLMEAPACRRLVVTSARAVFGLVPHQAHWPQRTISIAPGDTLDAAALVRQLLAWGFFPDDHVDEPGHFALRGKVLDIYPGDADGPLRLAVEDGRVAAIHRYDPLTQRTTADVAGLSVHPVVEIDPVAMRAGPDATSGLVCMLSYLPSAPLILADHTRERWVELQEEADDAHAATRRARRARTDDGDPYLPPPSRLFLSPDGLSGILAARSVRDAAGLGHGTEIPPYHGAGQLAAAIATHRATGRVVVAMADHAQLRAGLGRRVAGLRVAARWDEALAGPCDAAILVPVRLEAGFVRDGLTVLATSTIEGRPAAGPGLLVEEPPRTGDMVVHRDHGVCRLAALTIVDGEERVMLEFANTVELLVPVGELDRVWRYGSSAGSIALDHLHGPAWHKRRAEIAAKIAATARAIKADAAARAANQAPVIDASRRLGRFTRRFPYPLSRDQEAAIDAVLADLRAGRPMDRLVCGDVGFGKTEVALRAAAAAAFAGYQVAVMAPTSVLARQHVDLFTRRFAGLGITVASLLRGAGSKEAEATRAGLADGSIAIVVGTQAVAAPGIRFRNLALVVIDEEQRFGDADKKRLSALRNPAGGVHSLVMTATPIPRTLQGAMVGLRQISVIATPPLRRQPVRTFVLPFDAVVVREALMREHRRGGQAFVICPRIEDQEPVGRRLAEAVPELDIVTAHGRMKPQALEQIVAEFAAGEHDVLVATNIIEAGLDIPRANTILILRPDRFGLAQLHQMRGRVGRGERRGSAYLITEADTVLPDRTQRRLATLAANDRLGAGVEISLADMDARGAGDLFGERQAGHVHAIGTELYQHMLGAALASEDGMPAAPGAPELHLEVSGRIPGELVPEADLRLELYRRWARMTCRDAAADFLEEFRDRFGAVPEPIIGMAEIVEVRTWCAENGVDRLDAGPHAVALHVADPGRATALSGRLKGSQAKAGRVLLPLAIANPGQRLTALRAVLAAADGLIRSPPSHVLTGFQGVRRRVPATVARPVISRY